MSDRQTARPGRYSGASAPPGPGPRPHLSAPDGSPGGLPCPADGGVAPAPPAGPPRRTPGSWPVPGALSRPGQCHVPDDWPETAPHATVTKRIGNIVPSFALLNPVYTGRFIEGCATTRPTAAPTIMQINMNVVI